MSLLTCLTLGMVAIWISSAIKCAPKKYDQDSVVCVCNATYCDTVEDEGTIQPGTFLTYISSLSGLRLEKHVGKVDNSSGSAEVKVDVTNKTIQTILGFGGAFTDAATITVMSLSKSSQANLLQSYFSSQGIEYNIGRIPMASCDFSTRVYSYDDFVNDTNLTKFSLAEEDLIYKIPVIKQSISMSKRNISLFGSPWSSPFWMKTNNNMTGRGFIKGQVGGIFFKAWAKYFVKFIQQYKQHGLDIWGLTAQNEPTDGRLPGFSFQCLGWSAELQRDFIAKDLGPALEAAGLGHVKLMVLDDSRLLLPLWAEVVLHDPEAAKFVAGVAVHWYQDRLWPPLALEETYKQFGQKYFILATEACEQDTFDKKKSVSLGNWERAEHYFHDITQDLQNGVSGWVDWNIALNTKGGPNWVNNEADSPIIVNATADEFYKQPMFYTMGHFSKFVWPGSKVLTVSVSPSSFDILVFQRPDGNLVATLGNLNNEEVTASVHDSTVGWINMVLPARSLVTVVWSRSK